MLPLTNSEMEIIVEALEWAIPTYRAAEINSPEVKKEMLQRRNMARALIERFNFARIGGV